MVKDFKNDIHKVGISLSFSAANSKNVVASQPCLIVDGNFSKNVAFPQIIQTDDI